MRPRTQGAGVSTALTVLVHVITYQKHEDWILVTMTACMQVEVDKIMEAIFGQHTDNEKDKDDEDNRHVGMPK